MPYCNVPVADTPAPVFTARGFVRGQSEMGIASRAARALRRTAGAEFRVEDELSNPAMTWGSPSVDAPLLPRPELDSSARARQIEITVPVLRTHDELHEVSMVGERESRAYWKALLKYVDGQLQVLIGFDTSRASVSNHSEALFVEWMRRYIADVIPATDDEVLCCLAAVYGVLTAPNYLIGGAGSSTDASDREAHSFEWLYLREWGRVVTWRDYHLVR